MAPHELGYARVAVNVPIQAAGGATADAFQGAFTYAVPPHLCDTLRAGHLVWVPFGGRRVAGIVLERTLDAPSVEARPIEALAETEPVVLPAQIALAAWMAREYLVPLGRALWSMLPRGLLRRSEVWVEALEPSGDPSDLRANQRAVWMALRERGPMTLEQAGLVVRVAGWRQALAALVDKGLVRRWDSEAPPPVQPATERFVRLAAAEGADVALNSPRQRALYEYLAERRGTWLSQREVLAQTGVSPAVLKTLTARGLVETVDRPAWRDPLAGREFVLNTAPPLTSDQTAVLTSITATIRQGTHHTYLLHGVTGSGKTEVYLEAVAQTLAHGRRAIILVPEIALTPQTVRRFAARFPGRVTVCHSQLSLGERYDQWRRALAGEIEVVVGPRSALFLPLNPLGLIVVDEEHEPSYKQDVLPRYHAREAAVALGAITGACVILGSATPDMVTAYRAQQGIYTLLRLPRRLLSHRKHVEAQQERLGPALRQPPRATEANGDLLFGEMPLVEVVDLRRELREGNRSIFSRSLAQALQETVTRGAQAILFLNRRGSATFVLCRDCGQVLTCPRCLVPLAYHGEGRELVCHHCDRRQATVSVCPQCRGRRIKFFGLGTQRVVAAVQELLPGAHVVRWDRDAVRQKGRHEEILRQFIDHEADVLVGTQMVAKGLDLPLVTLVGVISADTALHLPDYRAAERTFQLLAQVAGRAGRSLLGGRAIIQTYTPEHYAIRAAAAHDYGAFYRRELAFRRAQSYPPFSRLVRLLYAHDDPARARAEAERLAAALSEHIRQEGLGDLRLTGPAPCPLERLRGRYRWHLFLRGAEPLQLLRTMEMPRGWRVDVDPGNLM
ncbi:MAG: replication restart helicase PriA [Anaerolineae bacterium]